jgi:HK97 family phage major capsid protein
MVEDVMSLKSRAVSMGKLEEAKAEMEGVIREQKQAQPKEHSSYERLGHFLEAIWNLKHGNHQPDPRLRFWDDREEPTQAGWMTKQTKRETKDLVENVGASGGFLVPIEQRETMFSIPAPEAIVRPRATVVPMRRRQIQWPVLDQTNTTSGRPAWFGGVRALWTEEGEYKTETDPAFRQINLVAHKLVSLTEASDELLDDSAIALEALLTQLFTGAISWYEEEAFINGTGAGQPLGVIGAGATFVQGRAAAGAVGLVDIINMLEHSYGNPVWLISRSVLPSLMQLNGPAANPSYVFMPSARDGMPGTLFGYPVFYNEHCPILGSRGDVGLYDFRYYLIGDRQATTIDSSKHDKFRYDLTVWRGVHRVDGQPWLSQPIYMSDGSTQQSPFVVLDAATGS